MLVADILARLRYVYFIICALIALAIISGILYARRDTIGTGAAATSVPNALCGNCNVILLSVDSLRADHVGAFGYARDTTPNFDAFSKKGALFVQYFTTSFLTPVSEMSVHTGLYPSANGVTNFDTVVPEDIVTLAQYLKGKGYRTSAILSSPEFSDGNPALKESFSRGFDAYEYASSQYIRDFPSRERIRSELESVRDTKFFLWLPVGGVHWPYGEVSENVYADDSYNGIFKGKKLDWEEFKNIYNGIQYPGGKKLRASDIQYVVDQYDNGVRAFDGSFGQLLGELEQRNLLAKTIVVVVSEHGEDLGEHGYIAHYDVMDTQIHTPLLIFVPTVQSGRRISSLVGSVDVFPTIIELLGGVVPARVQGKGLVPLIRGEEQDGLRQAIFTERNPLWEEAHKGIRQSLENRGIPVVSGTYKDIAIRTPEWKYILRTAKERVEKISWWGQVSGKMITIPKEELYNLVDDPLETKNVVDAYPDEAAALRTKLESWYENISTNSPQNVEHAKEIQPYF